MRKLYREKGIKKKVVQFAKNVPTRSRYKFNLMQIELKEDVQSAILQHFRVIMLDEMVVTKHSLPTHDFSKKKQNSEVDYSSVNR